MLDFDAVEFQPSAISTNSNSIGALWYTAFVTAIHEIVIEQLRPKFKFPAKIQMAFITTIPRKIIEIVIFVRIANQLN